MSGEKERPFSQWAAIHQSDKFICVEPLSGYGQAYWDYEGYKTFLEPGASEQVLGEALLDSLNRSRFLDPRKERDFWNTKRIMKAYKDWQVELMSRFKYRTKRDLYQNMDYCKAERSEGKISIRPHKRLPKPGYITDVDTEKIVVIPETADPLILGGALKLALSRCEAP